MAKIKKVIFVFTLTVLLSVMLFSGCVDGNGSVTVGNNPADNQVVSNIGGEVLQYPSSNENFEYNVYETYVEVTWYTGLSTDVVIPDEIDGLPVKVIGPYAFNIKRPEWNEKKQKFYVPSAYYEGMRIRGRSDNFAITSIRLPRDLIVISNDAFFHQALREVIIPDKVEKIGESAFDGNHLLTNVVFGSSVTEIGRRAFYDCNLKGQTVLPDSLITIGEYAFYIYGSDVNYNGVRYYSEDSLEGEAKLRGETFYDSWYDYSDIDLTQIKLYECGDATINIPASVTTIGEKAFSDKYTLQCPKGSGAVQYIINSGHGNYIVN